MTKINTKLLSKRFGCGLMAIAMLFAYFPAMATAVQITARKVVIGNSAPSANTTYVFTFTVPTTTAVKSASFTACTTASGTCTTPSNFSALASTLSSQPTGLGAAAGWTLSNVAGAFKLLDASNATPSSGSQTVSFTGATNPDTANATFFLRIATFSGSDWATGPLDTGEVAASTAGIVTVNAVVDETLTFTLGNTTVDLGTITPAAYGKGSSTMTVGTNASTGYSLSYTGNTLTTTGAKVIDAMASKTTLTALGASKQFGINLVLNTTPAVGANVGVGGTGAATTNYNTPNSYMFNTAGDVVATATAATNTNLFTTSYVSNITTDTAAGAYTTAINYVATANF